MQFRVVSLLPLVLISAACNDEENASHSPADAGGERDAATVNAPADGGQSSATGDGAISVDNLTIGVGESIDELTIVDGPPQTGNTNVSASTATEAGSTSDSQASSSAASSSDVFASSNSSSEATTTIETDVVTLVLDTGGDPGVATESSVELDAGSWLSEDASSDASLPDASTNDSSDAGVSPFGLAGCTRVVGERPATTPTLSAPQVAGLSLQSAQPGQPLAGSVQFQDAQSDATTLIVQVNSEAEHYLCTLSNNDLEQGSVDLGVLSLSGGFPEGGHTLYVGISDSLGNVSGYIAASLTVGTSSAQPVCGQAPRLLLGAVPSQSTAFYAEQNGNSPDYDAGSPLAVVTSTDLFLKLDECSQLLLAGDAIGAAPIGWDNCLLVEYRPTPDAPREAVWSYCSLPVFDTATGQQVQPAQEAPTVAGTSLNPPVPNNAAFGWPALTLDLLRYVPENHPNEFVLNLRLLDFGSVGSTTDVWLTAQTSQNLGG